MEFQYYGANCVRITTKKASIIVDDNLTELGLKSSTRAGDIALFTGKHNGAKVDTKITIDHPGEYEVSNVSLQGIAARAHVDAEGLAATMYKIVSEDIRVVVVGHIYPELTETQLESLGTVDVLVIPVGGNGYTLDGVGALKVIKKIEPKLVIPTHFADKAINYPVPQTSLDDALKAMSMEPKETLDKLKLKASDLTDLTQLVVLERQ